MKVQVIIGSIREGRVSEKIAKWAAAEAGTIEGFEVELVDLKDYVLPLFDEAVSPQYNPERKPEGNVKKWLDKLAEADGYILVTPEYNRTIPGVVKNALDYLDYQMAQKPVALVAHGGTGGAQAVANYRVAIPQLKAITVPDATYLTDAGRVINEEGELDDEAKANPYGPHGALRNTLEQLKWYAEALSAART